MIRCGLFTKGFIGNECSGGKVYQNICYVQTDKGSLYVPVYSVKKKDGVIYCYFRPEDINEVELKIAGDIALDDIINAIKVAIIEERMYVATK